MKIKARQTNGKIIAGDIIDLEKVESVSLFDVDGISWLFCKDEFEFIDGPLEQETQPQGEKPTGLQGLLGQAVHKLQVEFK